MRVVVPDVWRLLCWCVLLCWVSAGWCGHVGCSCWLLLAVVNMCVGIPGVCVLLWLCVLLFLVSVGVCESFVMIFLISVGCPDYVWRPSVVGLLV